MTIDRIRASERGLISCSMPITASPQTTEQAPAPGPRRLTRQNGV
jgi:hypothetical protein